MRLSGVKWWIVKEGGVVGVKDDNDGIVNGCKVREEGWFVGEVDRVGMNDVISDGWERREKFRGKVG